MNQSNNNQYEQWKYNVLYRRRMFFFPLLSIILILSWSYVYYNIVHGILDLQLALVVPIVLFILHILIVLIAFTAWGKRLMNKNQGNLFCRWCGASLALNMCFLIIPTTIDVIERYILLAFLSAVSVSIFHHFGVWSLQCTWNLQLFLIIIWSIAIWKSNIGPIVSTVLFLSLFCLTLASTLQEYELKKQYTTYATKKINSEIVSSEIPVNDVVKALHTLHGSLDDLQYLMNNENIATAFIEDENRWYWTPCFASIQESKYFCVAMYAAIKIDELEKDILLTQVNQFAFSRICEKLFVIYESIAKNSLPLFINDTVSEVFITAPQGIFELVLFLLLHETVFGHSPGITFIETEHDSEAWYMTVTIATLEEGSSNNNNNIIMIVIVKILILHLNLQLIILS